MTKRRYSEQRAQIVYFLQERKDHPTADVIYENIKEKCPTTSLGTVYRNLTCLTEDGMIRALEVGGKVHYDWDTSAHDHFVCRSCGAVLDAGSGISLSSLRRTRRTLAAKIEGCDVFVRGVCGYCLGKDTL